MWPNFVAVISLLCLALFAWAQAGPVPIVNEVSTQRSVGSKYGEYVCEVGSARSLRVQPIYLAQ